MQTEPVLINGQWRPADASGTFQATNPATCEPLNELYPVSSWHDCNAALAAADEAYRQLRRTPETAIADFLERYAAGIEAQREGLVQRAHAETALPMAPRLSDVELPRTTHQLRLAAAAARSHAWRNPVIDSAANIRSCYASLGPVCVFGPNNFPFAFNSVSGGDFAAAIAAGNPVIGKANSSHPGTTQRLAELAFEAAQQAGLPPATVQLLYRTAHSDGQRLVSDPRLGATGYTGSRQAGLTLKQAADRAGKLIYLELSSINPVVVLPGAVAERAEAISAEYVTSGLMAAGQFCTNPGLLIVVDDPAGRRLIERIVEQYRSTRPATLLSAGVQKSLGQSVAQLQKSGAKLLGQSEQQGVGYCCPNTVLQVTGQQFLQNPLELQAEAFGNAALVVLAADVEEVVALCTHLEGNLTGCVYSHTEGLDDAAYAAVCFELRPRVGRLLNDKMPTGVAVSPAMNHGGPYPATGHPGFTAVGIPTSIHRFAAWHCFDNVRPHRLPTVLQDSNPHPELWRWIDGQWTTADLSPAAG